MRLSDFLAGTAFGYLIWVLISLLPQRMQNFFHIWFCGALALIAGIHILKSHRLSRDAHYFTKHVIAEIERKQRELRERNQ